MFFHEAAESGQVGRDAGYAHDGALCRRVAPRLVVGGEHSHVAATDKLVILQAEQRVGGRQELGMEDDLDTVRTLIEQLASSKSINDWILLIK